MNLQNTAEMNRKIKVVSFLTSLITFLLLHSGVCAQKLDVAYVPTPDFVVERMLDMADVGPGDYVVDLGCGDGRINIAAAERGALGHGVDLDPERVKEARENAEKAGVADKVVFLEENIYNTDFSRATVIAMYLFPSINMKLRPKFLNELEPGTRIVSHDFAMDDWKPDQQHGQMATHAVFLWIVPAKAEGTWNWELAGEKFQMNVNQEFQEIDVDIWAEGKSFEVSSCLLSGKRISFTAIETTSLEKLVFSGKIEDGKIEGVVQNHGGKNKLVENWSAVME